MNKKILSFALTLSLIGSSFAATTEQITPTKEVVKAAIATAEKAYPKRGVKKVILNNIPAALAGAATAACCQFGTSGIISLISSYWHKDMQGQCQHSQQEKIRHHEILHNIQYAGHFIMSVTSVLVAAATRELWKQHTARKKNHMIIEHVVKHFAEHQNELNEGQKAVFAPLITELNEKKSLNIKNPEETLAQLQAAL